jgi:putative phage-type endonuclease
MEEYIIKNLKKIKINDLTYYDIKKSYDQYIQINQGEYFPEYYVKMTEIMEKKINEKNKKEVQSNYNFYDEKIIGINKLIEDNEKNLEMLKNIKKKILKEKVILLGKLNQPVQLSQEWFDMREGMLTASDIGSILGYNKYSNKDSVVKKKCHMVKPFTGNQYTLHGQKYEEVANKIYDSRYNTKTKEYGLIQHPIIDILGASPDGITTEGIMIEIKCPPRRKITGEIPPHYWVQMQTQLQVCQLEECDFVECKIEEYLNETDYNEDEFEIMDFEYLDINPKTFDIDFIKVPMDRRNYLGLEKGLIGMTRERKYYYPPFHYNTKKQKEWLLKKEEDIEIIYWKLSYSSVVKVKRDDNWWIENKVEEKLEKVWDEIIIYKDDGVTEDFSKIEIGWTPNNIFYKTLPQIDEILKEEGLLSSSEGCLLSSDSD